MTDKPNPLPCLICNKSLTHAIARNAEWDDGEYDNTNQPNNGVSCVTYGNYGSTIYDSFDGSRLEFVICDTCLEERWSRLRESRFRRPAPILEVLGSAESYEEYIERQRSIYRSHQDATGNTDSLDDMNKVFNDISEQKESHRKEGVLWDTEQNDFLHGTIDGR